MTISRSKCIPQSYYTTYPLDIYRGTSIEWFGNACIKSFHTVSEWPKFQFGRKKINVKCTQNENGMNIRRLPTHMSLMKKMITYQTFLMRLLSYFQYCHDPYVLKMYAGALEAAIQYKLSPKNNSE